MSPIKSTRWTPELDVLHRMNIVERTVEATRASGDRFIERHFAETPLYLRVMMSTGVVPRETRWHVGPATYAEVTETSTFSVRRTSYLTEGPVHPAG